MFENTFLHYLQANLAAYCICSEIPNKEIGWV